MEEIKFVFFITVFISCILHANHTVLVFSPHPDDDILGCGGSIAQHIQQKNTVHVVFMTSGEKGNKKIDKTALARIREQEAVKAEKVLGCTHCVFLRNPDGKLALTDETIKQVIQSIEQTAPDFVYIPHAADSHKDHKMTYTIVTSALKTLIKQNKIPLPLVYCYEVWTPLQRYTHLENISKVMPLKLAALHEHKTQLQSLAYAEAVECLNRYRGIMSKKKLNMLNAFIS